LHTFKLDKRRTNLDCNEVFRWTADAEVKH
jgi:hypothetical protein